MSTTLAGGFAVIAVSSVRRLVHFPMRSWQVGIAGDLLASLAVMLSAPSHLAVVQLQSTPARLVALIGSFVPFGLGTLGPVIKHRWSTP